MQSTEQQIEALENQFMQAIQKQDKEAALKLSDDVCLLTSGQGASQVDKAKMRAMMEKPDYELKNYTLSDVQVREVNSDVAVIGYKLHQDFIKDGKPLALDTVNSSTWVRKGESWVCAMHTEALAGDPWGQKKDDQKQ